MKIILLCAIALGLISACLACGGGSEPVVGDEPVAGDEPQSKVVQADGLYTLDDFTAAGFKRGKTFDVNGLTEATEAFYGFWGLDPYDRKEYEVRFYGSHEDALAHGLVFAEERIGRDAKLKIDEATWKQGLKEARACTRHGVGYSDSSNCAISRYGDYVVYGNVILICQGANASDGRDNCDALIAQIR